MGLITDLIKYNIKERMREFRGQKRNFDAEAAARLINSGAIQEQVKNGDMKGFYGHWPRVKFGMNPQEGGFVDGKQVSLEPAIRCVHLKASPNGEVEHKIEFLDTPSGKLAQRLYEGKMGGFSSAIDFKRVGDKEVPYGFYGFDFVWEPNFNNNRGYALDSVDGIIQALDEVDDYNAMIGMVNTIFDEKAAENEALKKQVADMQLALDTANATVEHLVEENEVYLAELAKENKSVPALDSARDLIRFNHNSKFDDAENFKTATLEQFSEIEEKGEEKSENPTEKRLLRRLGF